MKTYGKKYKQGFITEAWENPKNPRHGVKSKKRARQDATSNIDTELSQIQKITNGN
jgi:hypothetical protein